MPSSLRFTRIVSMTNELAAHLQKLQFAGLHHSEVAWRPDVNVYAYADRMEVCVDLAGVNKQDITVDVEAQRLIVRGQREAPGGGCEPSDCCRVLVMEIADGPFERVLEFPVKVASEHVVAKHDNGWLRITLPVVDEEEAP